MNILLTGASGVLGSELLRITNAAGISTFTLDRNSFLSASASVKSTMLSGYDVLIHAAANTDLEECERNPTKCFYDNTYLTEELFRYSRCNNVKFVYISSTGVYGRHKSIPYHEFDVVVPTTTHHRSKYLSEINVLRDPNSLVIRTGWLFGGAPNQRKNFVANRIDEIKSSKNVVYSNATQYGSPTYARDCAERIINLLDDKCCGVYNVVNTGNVSRMQYVDAIARILKSNVQVLPVDARSFARLADVSENEAALSLKMNFENRPPMRNWRDALEEYIKTLNC